VAKLVDANAAPDDTDRDRLERRIKGENRYGRRVVRLAEQFGLGIVAFRGVMLHGQRFVLSGADEEKLGAPLTPALFLPSPPLHSPFRPFFERCPFSLLE
jgi:hypothetical protein